MGIQDLRLSRRAALMGAAAARLMPAARSHAQTAGAVQRDGLKPQKIAAVELVEFKGHYETEAGVNGQSQVNPLDIYDDLRKPVDNGGQFAGSLI